MSFWARTPESPRARRRKDRALAPMTERAVAAALHPHSGQVEPSPIRRPEASRDDAPQHPPAA